MRGIAHIGALTAFEEHGFDVHRVAGASAGAVAGALAVAGAEPSRIRSLLTEMDYRRFAFSDILSRLSTTPAIGDVLERFGRKRTRDPQEWLEEVLGEYGIETFADLRLDGDHDHVPPARRYRLVVRCLDIANNRVVRLPWDYERYGLDPDTQSVARAVRASMSVPLVWDPVHIGGPDSEREGLLVDGGLTSGFPVAILDRNDGTRPRWPTFGVRLLPRPRNHGQIPQGDVAVIRAVVTTLLDSADALESADTCDEERTVRIDASDVNALDLDLEEQDSKRLFDAGYEAVATFLDGWNWDGYLERCRPA